MPDQTPDLPPLDPARHALREHVLRHSVKRGDFTLKSGATSTWFLDTKQTACRPDGVLLMADVALSLIPDDATAIGGLTVGADPVAYAVAAIGATRAAAEAFHAAVVRTVPSAQLLRGGSTEATAAVLAAPARQPDVVELGERWR